jgi:glycosyltransferase involved in cell wall biosynthesis
LTVFFALPSVKQGYRALNADVLGLQSAKDQEESDGSFMPELKVIGFSRSWHSACQHLRLLSPVKAAGFDFTAVNLQDDLQKAVEDCDLVFITRQFPADEAEAYDRIMALARANKKSVMYETDDLLTDLPKDHPEWRTYSSQKFRYVTALLEADHVLVTNETLKDALKSYNDNIHVMPNYLDDTMWRFSPGAYSRADADAPVVVGYMGTVTHKNDLQLVEPALVSVLNHYEGKVRLKLWGVEPVGRLINHEFVDHVSNCPGEYDLFIPFFAQQQADIFIAPLTENRFNSCKSFLKYLEYSTLGVPGVYSQGAEYSKVIKDGVTGYLAGNLLEWQTCLTALIEKRDLREKIGANALADVKHNWSLNAHASEIASLFRFAAANLRAVAPDPALISLAKEAAQWASELAYDGNGTRAAKVLEDGKQTVVTDQEHRRELEKMKQRLLRMRAELTASQRHASGLDNLVVNLTQSWAWRVGNVVTQPARNLRQAMGNRKIKKIEISRHV